MRAPAGDIETAIKILEEEIAYGSGNPIIYNNLGCFYSNLCDYEEALYNYDFSIQLKEKNPLAYCNRGLLRYYKLKDKGGIADLIKATEYGDLDAYVALQKIGNNKQS